MRAHKKFDRSTGLFDLDFIFIFSVIDFRGEFVFKELALEEVDNRFW